jgi:Protein of unknown function (DUF3038)
MMPASIAKWDDLSIEVPLDSAQLHTINLELELVTIAMVALAQIDRLEIGQVAQDLQVESLVANWIEEWPQHQFTDLNQLNLEQIRSLVLVVDQLAHKYQSVVRQTITDWQNLTQANRLPLESPPLAEYIGNFIKIYQTRLSGQYTHSIEALSQAALNLLLELLFYGGTQGHQRLWQALLNRSHAAIIPPIPT